MDPPSSPPAPTDPPAQRLDARGTVCPVPILLTAKAIQKLSLGQVLEVLGDDPAILEDMPVYCTRAGHRLLEMEKGEEGLVRCLVQKVAEG